MSDLVVFEFDNKQAAFDMRAALAKMQKEYLIQMEDVVVVTKNEKGKVKLHQAVNLTAAGDKVLERLKTKEFRGKALKTSLTVDAEDELRKVLEEETETP